MPDWMGPSETWPRHPRSSARDALAYAQANGWWFKPSSGHSFGRLTCCEPTGEARATRGEVCELQVRSTPGGATEDTAKIIRGKVDKCRHVPEEPADDASDSELTADKARAALGHLDSVDALIDAFEKLVEADAAEARRDELLEQMVEARDDAIEAYREAEELAERAEEAMAEGRRRARELADTADYGSQPWPPRVPATRLLGPAETFLEIVLEMVEGETGEAVDRVRAEVQQRCERIAELREEHPDDGY